MIFLSFTSKTTVKQKLHIILEHMITSGFVDHCPFSFDDL